ncbi:hypothetical protein D0T49_02270 [Paludibacter sp. 221]|nr:hypothetical protein [Paludibacter sp. 221]
MCGIVGYIGKQDAFPILTNCFFLEIQICFHTKPCRTFFACRKITKLVIHIVNPVKEFAMSYFQISEKPRDFYSFA